MFIIGVVWVLIIGVVCVCIMGVVCVFKMEVVCVYIIGVCWVVVIWVFWVWIKFVCDFEIWVDWELVIVGCWDISCVVIIGVVGVVVFSRGVLLEFRICDICWLLFKIVRIFEIFVSICCWDFDCNKILGICELIENVGVVFVDIFNLLEFELFCWDVGKIFDVFEEINVVFCLRNFRVFCLFVMMLILLLDLFRKFFWNDVSNCWVIWTLLSFVGFIVVFCVIWVRVVVDNILLVGNWFDILYFNNCWIVLKFGNIVLLFCLELIVFSVCIGIVVIWVIFVSFMLFEILIFIFGIFGFLVWWTIDVGIMVFVGYFSLELLGDKEWYRFLVKVLLFMDRVFMVVFDIEIFRLGLSGWEVWIIILVLMLRLLLVVL